MTPGVTRPLRPRVGLLSLVVVLVSCESATGPAPVLELPITGAPVPELTAFDSAMVRFMRQRNTRAGTLAVLRDGVTVLEHGYGWKDEELQTPLPADALLRLASLTKFFTYEAIEKLYAEGRLDVTDRAFCLEGSPTSCWLDIEPWGLPDPRSKGITILHLLDHYGGWWTNTYGLIIGFKALHIAGALGVPTPPTKNDVARYVLGRPLDYTPGTYFAYSNFGFMVLGLVIEEVTGQSYESYVQDELMNPLGVADTEVELGRSLPELRNPREPWYDSPLFGTSVYDPPATVRMPDGGFHQEGIGASGALVGTARAVAMAKAAYTPAGASTHQFGGGPGTFTMARVRPDGTVMVALFNRWRELDSEPPDEEIARLLDAVADGIAEWPSAGPTNH